MPGARPSAEQLRSLDARTLREIFEMGLEEAKRMKVEQRVRDYAELMPIDPAHRRCILDLLYLITGRVE